jgi:quercetin dioxygenase-like cupin family protein
MIHACLNDKLREQASLYALGLLELSDKDGYERHLNDCIVCRREAEAFASAANELLFSVPFSSPGPALREKTLAGIAAPSVLIRRDQGVWQETPFQGVELKQLFVDGLTGAVTSLVRMKPGAKYPAHCHAGTEHCYVLEGDLVFSDHTLHAGDYEVSSAATEHSWVTTKAGCLLFLTNNQADVVLA